jgi:hypothetical protein
MAFLHSRRASAGISAKRSNIADAPKESGEAREHALFGADSTLEPIEQEGLGNAEIRSRLALGVLGLPCIAMQSLKDLVGGHKWPTA